MGDAKGSGHTPWQGKNRGAEDANRGAREKGPGIIRPRAPAPPASEIIPAAVVVGRETPGRIVNPGPAPRADPVPIAGAVRSPVNRNFARIPNEAVFRFIAPIAVTIQIAVTGHIDGSVFPCNSAVVF